MLSDKVILAYPYTRMIERVSSLKFVTEQVNGRYFMSLLTPEGTFKVLEFESLQATTDMTAKFLSATSGIFMNIASSFETKIGNILNA